MMAEGEDNGNGNYGGPFASLRMTAKGEGKGEDNGNGRYGGPFASLRMTD